jgi:hypothetical protein
MASNERSRPSSQRSAVIMIKSLFQSTPTLLLDSKKQKIVYRFLVLLMALGQFLCASGSGPSSGDDAVSGWVHIAMNGANITIGLLVLMPKTRALAAVLSAVIATMSMMANDAFYGSAYFFKLLPFDGSLFLVSLLILVHHWPDLRYTFKANPSPTS